MSILFTPFTLRGLTIPNRIAMAPMTRNFSPSGVPGADVAEYYRRRAQGGVGLIISEGTVVNRPEARNAPGIPFFHGKDALAGWHDVVDAVHGEGGLFAPQIWHTGLVREQYPDKPRPSTPEGPSGLFRPGEPYGQAMSEKDVIDTIAAFVESPRAAAEMGCDAVELHGAHGYLIDQFFWSGTNQRSDEWGGPALADRTMFAAEIVSAVREAIGDTPLILRISQWNQQDYTRRLALTPSELEAWTRPLIDAGADMLHCSQRRFWEPEFPEIDGENGLNFAGWVKKLTGIPTMSVGSVGLSDDFFGAFKDQKTEASTDLGQLESRMEAGEFDMIAVGRALIANPDWVSKVREGRLAELSGYRTEMLQELA